MAQAACDAVNEMSKSVGCSKDDSGKADYNLRNSSLVNRVQSERRRSEPKQPKPKTNPPPLSKYRRRAANSRERTRMSEINIAFDTLQSAIPIIEHGPGLKMTKITTLRLALNYICALRQMLGYEEDLNSDASSSRSSTISSGDESCASPSDMEFTVSEAIADPPTCFDIKL